MKYAWIEQHRDSYSVTLMCQLLGVSRSVWHAARVRGASARARSDAQLLEEIQRRQRRHRGRYGAGLDPGGAAHGAGLARSARRIGASLRSRFAAHDYRNMLAARGITVSMSRKGNCWDNAPMESANGTVKVECVHGAEFETRTEAAQALVEYFGYYNTERLHSLLGYLTPSEFERRWRAENERHGTGVQ